MLDPKTSENSCTQVGKLIISLIRQATPFLGEHLETLLKSVLSKMQSSNTLLVQQSLIMVFAHLMHTKLDAVLSFLSNVPGPTGEPGLNFLMTEWVYKQNSFSGPYECKVR
jgi:importin-9